MSLQPLIFLGWQQLLSGDICRHPAKQLLQEVPGRGWVEGARKHGGPGASAGDGSDWRGTGCYAWSAQLEEAVEPQMHAKTPEPAHGTICASPAPSTVEQHSTISPSSPSRWPGQAGDRGEEPSAGRGLL